MRVESVDKVERSTLAVECTEADFRTLETALYQMLHRTTTNEPLRMVQQVQTHSVSIVKKIDTSAPMEIGMASGTDGEEAFEEVYGKASEFAVQTVCEERSQLECAEILQQRQK